MRRARVGMWMRVLKPPAEHASRIGKCTYILSVIFEEKGRVPLVLWDRITREL